MLMTALSAFEDQDRGDPCKNLLFIGREDFIPRCNMLAIAHYFPDFSITTRNRFSDLPHEEGNAFRSAFIDETYLDALTTEEKGLIKRRCNHIIAVVDTDIQQPPPSIDQLVSDNFIRGVLPMNLRLEIWLLTVDLFLRGGEFVPASFLRPHWRSAQPVEKEVVKPRLETRIAALTEREREVLEMVSAGCSNRIIAARCGLSEHTVKVHVHNIIRKLKAPNRTAAAAIFFRRPPLAIDPGLQAHL